jgi:polyhydroxyalkanoate synthase
VALADTARKGYLDGRTLAQIFAWMRPSDLIWGYWVNNYLLGNDPPPFDVLVWNADYTNMPAGLHRDFLELALRNALATPGGVEVLGTPIDLSTVDCDLYVVAGIDDHIVPWENAYRSALMFGSQPRFVLSNSGHIASQVNPPDNPKASYQHNPGLPEDPQEWLAGSAEHRGSWWVDWTDWLAERSGRERPAPKRLGGDDHEPLGPAPGEYVLETVG